MKKFRFLSLTLCLALIFTLFTAACNGGSKVADKEKEPTTAAESSSKAESTENGTHDQPGSFPLAKEKITMTVFGLKDPKIEDISTNKFTRWYEEKTNVHIEWDLYPSDVLKEKNKLIIAGGDLPDILMNPAFQDGNLVYSLGKQGVILQINALIDQWAPEYKSKMEKEPMIAMDTADPDTGAIYGFSSLQTSQHVGVCQKMWINKTWLDKLGLDIPRTTDQFYETLKAFKENDPNGNKKKDEIPLTGGDSNKGAWMGEIQGFLASAFLQYRSAPWMPIYDCDVNDPSKITVPMIQPEYKEALKYIQKLFSEKLIDQAFLLT